MSGGGKNKNKTFSSNSLSQWAASGAKAADSQPFGGRMVDLPNTKRPLRACPAPLPPPPTSGSLRARPPLPGSLTGGAATLPARSGRPEGTGRKGAADLTTLSSGRRRGGGTGSHTGVETERRSRGCGPDGATPGPQLPAPRGQKARTGDPGPRPSSAVDPGGGRAGRSPGHAPLPAFPEPPAAAPSSLGPSSLGGSTSRRRRAPPA